MDDPPVPSPRENDTQPTKKRGRRDTRMKLLCLCKNGIKAPINFDPRTKIPLGKNMKKIQESCEFCNTLLNTPNIN